MTIEVSVATTEVDVTVGGTTTTVELETTTLDVAVGIPGPTGPTGPGGGGSGLPPQWSDGGHGDVTAVVDEVDASALTIAAFTGQTAPLLSLLDEDGNNALKVVPSPNNGQVYLQQGRDDASFQNTIFRSPGGGSRGANVTWYAQDDAATRWIEAFFATSIIGADGTAPMSQLGVDCAATIGHGHGTLTLSDAAFTFEARAQPGQTVPLLDLKDENNGRLFTVAQAFEDPTTTSLVDVVANPNDARIRASAVSSPGNYREADLALSLNGRSAIEFDAFEDEGDGTNSYTKATLTAQVGQTAANPLLQLNDENGTPVFSVAAAGTVTPTPGFVPLRDFYQQPGQGGPGGSQIALEWTLVTGGGEHHDNLLAFPDDHTDPAVIDAGVYALTLTVAYNNREAGKWAAVEVNLDNSGADYLIESLFPLDATFPTFNGGCTSLAATLYLPAGAVLIANTKHNLSVASGGITFSALVVKLS